ncbi:MAG TPA: hypothetical protein VFN30_15385 [Chitinophagaceae bacterium]|nr:hypothetical protein [Chitinophagaceae bacterium]
MTRVKFIIISLGLSLLIGGKLGSDFYSLISFTLFFFFLLDFTYSFGKDLRILDLPILLSVFQCLVMPAVVYHVYNDDYYVKRLRFNMVVEKEAYFAYMLPAILALIIGLKFPLKGIKSFLGTPDFYKTSVFNIKEYLRGKEKTGIVLIGVGVGFGVFELILPQSLSYIFFLFSKLIYVGIMYVYFSESKDRNIYLAGGLILALAQSLLSGLFGELVFLSALSFLLIMLGKKINFTKSIVLLVIGSFLVILIQSAKGGYRKVVWRDSEADKVSTFTDVIFGKLTNIDELFDARNTFSMVARFNQGMLVAKVMDYVPKVTPYQDGKTIWLSLTASFVPRYIWEDKPEAGGHANMLLFTGYKIEGYSMNVSPYGEAYGNFGKMGGIIYMFFYGLFFNFVFYKALQYSQRKPTVLLWLPYLFLYSIQIETDTLLTVNSIIKNTIFIWFFAFMFQRIARLSL